MNHPNQSCTNRNLVQMVQPTTYLNHVNHHSLRVVHVVQWFKTLRGENPTIAPATPRGIAPRVLLRARGAGKPPGAFLLDTNQSLANLLGLSGRTSNGELPLKRPPAAGAPT